MGAMNERLRTGLSRLWRRVTGVSIRYKLLGMVMAVILFSGAAITAQVQVQLQRDLQQSLEERGIALARNLAEDSTNLILTQDIFALYQSLRTTLETNPDVRYVFLLNPQGQVIAHSFPSRVPPDLLGVNVLTEGQPWQIQTLQSEEGLLSDVAAPVFEGKLGTVRLGLSHQRMQQAIQEARRQVALTILVALLAGSLAVLVLTRVLTRPIFDLVGAARAVGRGDLEVRPPVRMEDEIGELTAAFNAMTQDLARFRDELLRQNRELSTLNAVAQAISGARSLDEVIDRALQEALHALDCPAGWVVLARPDEPGDIQAQYGLSPDFLAREVGYAGEACRCHRILRAEDAWQQPVLRQDCPRLQRAMLAAEPEARFAAHLSVPLIAHDQPVGVLNLALAPGRTFSPDETQLAGALGRQLGVAVDAEQQRQRLMHELQRREQLRGQLLERVLAVQEEERRRIARELHDEAGQALTALMVGLRLLENEREDPLAMLTRIADLKRTADAVLENLHRLAMDLRPASLDHLGLVAALQQYTETCAQRYQLDVQFEAVGLDETRLPAEIEIALYRVVQEALTNVARHAQASRADVLLEQRGNCLVLIVEDDGVGFTPLQDTGRLGVFGMHERAEMLGGRLTIESQTGQGTTLYMEIPYEHSHSDC
ncbi:MAG: hypothetical protein Fur0018_24680 [Anaerolineales bacterium]